MLRIQNTGTVNIRENFNKNKIKIKQKYVQGQNVRNQRCKKININLNKENPLIII